MIRLIRDLGGLLTLTILDTSGDPIDATGIPRITIKDGAGTTITGPDDTAKRPTSTGIYDFSVLAAHTAILDTYEDTWTFTVSGDAKTRRTNHEVVGGFLFGLDDLRGLDSKLDDEVKYPEAKLVKARERAEELFERETGISFRPRGERVKLDGGGKELLILKKNDGSPIWNPRLLVSGSIDDAALTATEIADVVLYDWGALLRKDGAIWARGNRNVSLYLEVGLDSPPASVTQEAAKLALSYLIPTAIPDRAISVSSGGDTFRLMTADRGAITGLPSVDACIKALRHELPAVG